MRLLTIPILLLFAAHGADLQAQQTPSVPPQAAGTTGAPTLVTPQAPAASPEPTASGPQPQSFSVLAADASSWPDVLSSIGLQPQSPSTARIVVARGGTPAAPEWPARIESGVVLIVEGQSPLAEEFGFRPGKTIARVASLTDTHYADLAIVWEKPLDLPVFELPADARVFTRERWTSAPLIAGVRRGLGAVLWVATSPGDEGHERYPYLLEALTDMGVEAPFRSSRLWAFFDSSYRLRIDFDYFAPQWRKGGISALHVAAWHYYEPDAGRDEYLKRLIAACHREGILVYAWLELPHVSEKFWTDHPEWREKTALLQDAELDWRKLMNLTNRDCFRAVSAGVQQLVARFDWDGINLAELYFESLQGIGNPSRFTPMNDDVRAEFRKAQGFDPMLLFPPVPRLSQAGQTSAAVSLAPGVKTEVARSSLVASSTRPVAPNSGAAPTCPSVPDPNALGPVSSFLAFRSELARRMQEEWIGVLESIRRSKPHLDLVLTHVDDRFDTGMREAIGADAARVLPLLDRHAITFLIEDPATVWHLGPQRYHSIAERYRALTPHREELAIDVNIVNRYQNVYPTRQQTGIELFQLVHNAAANFQRVALYFENSLLAPDLDLLPSAAAAATVERFGVKAVVNSVIGVGLPWKGPAMVDGQAWPAADPDTLWLPAGPHTVEPGVQAGSLHLVRLNADLKAARLVSLNTVEFSYEGSARAIAIFDRAPRRMQVDGVETPLQRAGPMTVLLPRGHHTVTLTAD